MLAEAGGTAQAWAFAVQLEGWHDRLEVLEDRVLDRLEQALVDWRNAEPDGVLKLAVDPEADYQSAATAMATAQRAGVGNIGLVEP